MAVKRAGWVRRAAREAARARLDRARQAVRDASAGKRSAVRRARQTCRDARVATREWIARARIELQVEIERMRAQLRSTIAAKREAVRECCGPDRAKVRAKADAKIAAAREQLEELRRERARERAWASSAPLKAGERGKRTRERKAESEHDVTSDLSADELIVWQAVRTKIGESSARMSRLERFRHWLHEHPGEVARILERDAQRAYNEALKREAEERKQLEAFRRGMRKRSDGELRDYLTTELADVPF